MTAGQNMFLDISLNINLMLNPRMLQMLNVLNLPYAELVEKIKTEAEENPLIEIERRDAMIEYLRYHSSTPLKETPSGLPEEGSEAGFEHYIQKGVELVPHLMSQAGLLDISEKEKEIVTELIKHLDINGYIRDWESVSPAVMSALGAAEKEIEEALGLLQGLEPDGIGARDLKECLLIQISEYDFEDETLVKLLKKAVSSHLDEIASRDLAAISKSLDITEEGALQICDFIKNNLTPYPGAAFSSSATPAIPSFSVKKEGPEIKLVNLETRYGPVIKLSPQYLKMLKDPGTDAATVSFIKEKIDKANELIEQLAKRGETLEKIAVEITEKQKDYLFGKSAHPAPLLQKSISAKFGIHPSTVSRAVSEKYIETPKGVISLKSLCPKEILGTTTNSLREKVLQLISAEDNKAPLSDSDIQRLLSARGFDIKRRTVTDYRKKLSIGTVAERKKGKP
ncbi:MAG: RNA polymerase factor sigma-54 [Candidatus Saganbacteria bacterium]|nr:RNA polymerase factor sigma-54 [Candidatus Saganbacteria bacterium]